MLSRRQLQGFVVLRLRWQWFLQHILWEKTQDLLCDLVPIENLNANNFLINDIYDSHAFRNVKDDVSMR